MYGQGIISDGQVKMLSAGFRSGEMSLEDEPRLGCSSDLVDKSLTSLVGISPRQSTRKL